jgi:hypothetical protein
MSRWHAYFVLFLKTKCILAMEVSCHNPTRNNNFDDLNKVNELLIVDCKHFINRTISYLGSLF